MKTDTHETGSLVQNAPQQPSGAGNGIRQAPGSAVTGLPPLPDRVRRRAVPLISGRELSPQQLAMVAVTARLIVHLERLSDRLMRDGEATREGEPKLLLGRVQDLARQIKTNLEAIFGDDAGGDLSSLLGRPSR